MSGPTEYILVLGQGGFVCVRQGREVLKRSGPTNLSNQHECEPFTIDEKEAPKVINFTWGSLPVDALNQQTIKELQVIANQKGTTIEEVMSKALIGCSRLPSGVQG